MSEDKQAEKLASLEDIDDVLSTIEKWKRTKMSKVMESGMFAGLGIYYIYYLKTVKNKKGYQMMTTVHKLRHKTLLVIATTGLFCLTASRVLDVGIFHPYKGYNEQMLEEMQWVKNKGDQLLGNKPVQEGNKEYRND